MAVRGILPVLAPVLLLVTLSCSRTVVVLKDDLVPERVDKIDAVTLPTGREIVFGPEGGVYRPRERLIIGCTPDGEELSFSIDQVRRIRVTEVREGGLVQVEKHPHILARRAAGWPSEKITAVVMPSGESIWFDEEGGQVRPSPLPYRIVGSSIGGGHVEVPVDDILYAQIRRWDPVMTAVAVVAAIGFSLATMTVIVLLTKESCPFVYSFDGERYVLDAEPIGGAITKGMERTDLSRLEHLRPSGGRYRLLVRNEVEEMQVLDHLGLAIVDHASDVEPIVDSGGRVRLVAPPRAPILARDENSADMAAFFAGRDGIMWQSVMPRTAADRLDRTSHELTFAFARPEGATRAHLLFNAGASLWGSNMIREMLELRGPSVGDWYHGIDSRGPEWTELNAFLDREELYHLKVRVRNDDGWRVQGVLRSGGPLIFEDCLIEVDLARVSGDTLWVRLTPPAGFWAIDFVGLTPAASSCDSLRIVSLMEARDAQGREITAPLASRDGRYYTMPFTGDWLTLVFPAPEGPQGGARTVFLVTSGYYRIQFPADRPDRTAELLRLAGEPGGMVRYAHDRFVEWRSALTEAREGAP